MLALLAVLWAALDPALVEMPRLLSTEAERVAEPFSRCGRGRSHACVVDGDTFRIGRRRIRIIGIDAPEMQGACTAESRLADQAAARLQVLLNAGPFEMRGRIDNLTDRYGRELRSLQRRRADGSIQSIAAEMRDAGLARRYLGFKSGWC